MKYPMGKRTAWLCLGLALPLLETQAAHTGQLPATPGPPPPGDALTINSWADLKNTMDSIGSEVQEVLTVRNDITMLQEDLLTQEQTWHKAEMDLQGQVDMIKAKALRIHGEAVAGASIVGRVHELKEGIALESQKAAAAKKLYEYDAQTAAVNQAHLENRIDELRRRLAEVRAVGGRRLEEARFAAQNTTNETMRLERQATRLLDEARDEGQALRLEQSIASDKVRDIHNRMQSIHVTMTGLRSQLLAPGQMDAQIEAMKDRVDRETEAMVEVTTAKEQQKQECAARTKTVMDALLAEQNKAAERNAEMSQVCDAATQRRTLLEAVVKEACEQVPEDAISLQAPVALPATLAPEEVLPPPAPAPGPAPGPYVQLS